MKINKNVMAGVILFVFSLCYIILTTQVRVFSGPGAAVLTSRSIPYAWGYLLMALSIVLIVREIIKLKKNHEADDTEIAFERKCNIKSIILTLLLLVLTIACLKYVGFLLSSAFFIFTETMVLSKKGERNIAVAVINAIVVSIVIDYVFSVLLGVMLPKGIIGF